MQTKKPPAAREVEFWAKAANGVSIAMDHPKFDLLKALSTHYTELIYPNSNAYYVHLFIIFRELSKLVK